MRARTFNSCPESGRPLRRAAWALAAALLAAFAFGGTPLAAQATNQITAVSSSSAVQGTTGLLVTFTLDTDVPPAPPAGILPVVWTNGTTAGHPGYGSNGTLDLERSWDAAGFCGVTADDHGQYTCP